MSKPTPPKHLSYATRRWWRGVLAVYDLEDHHLRLLQLACEAWDRAQQARQAITEFGLTFVDKHDQPRSRPEVQIERDSRIAFARLVRELDLDADAADPSRPPSLRSNRRR